MYAYRISPQRLLLQLRGKEFKYSTRWLHEMGMVLGVSWDVELTLLLYIFSGRNPNVAPLKKLTLKLFYGDEGGHYRTLHLE